MDNLAQDGNMREVQKIYDEAVIAIKRAILLQQVNAARQVNAVQLALYYSVGKFVST